MGGAAFLQGVPRLLLHCCCAPCAGYVLEHLALAYRISALFFNPNIMPGDEFYKRRAGLEKLLSQAVYPNNVDMLISGYDNASFLALAGPYMDGPEGGARCRVCFSLRLGEAARRAKSDGYGFFATTLTVSPHKDAGVINEVGVTLQKEYGVTYLASDFKKNDGYKRSVEISKQYGLYRQSYCGCVLVK